MYKEKYVIWHEGTSNFALINMLIIFLQIGCECFGYSKTHISKGLLVQTLGGSHIFFVNANLSRGKNIN